MRSLLIIIGLLILIAIEILRVYFIMPFPGSQHKNTIELAYWLNRNIIWLRVLLLVIITYPIFLFFRHLKIWQKIVVCIGLILYAVIFYFFNFRFLAQKMFLQPHDKSFASISNNKIGSNKLVIGVEFGGEAKAYPIQIIGYHHFIMDTVGNTPVIITYCTVCRTGRVFSPLIKGKLGTFRLVGMDHFNAMLEDASTKSWWQQATGIAVVGPLKGNALHELPSQQLSLSAWLRKHPASSIMQEDTFFHKQYEDLALYDKGTLKSSLEKRDSLSWNKKSWVVGIDQHHHARAYDWNELVAKQLIQDSLVNLPLIIFIEKDSSDFHVWSRMVNGKILNFEKDLITDGFVDLQTHSTWTGDGLCVAGILKGHQLQTIQAYQEFWHSWQTFHPNTTKYN